jgi:hypothetical protein
LAVHCEARCFEKLPGYVDVDIFSTDNLNSLKETPERMAVAVCCLEPTLDLQVQTYHMLVESQKEAKVSQLRESMQTFELKLKSIPTENLSYETLKEYME